MAVVYWLHFDKDYDIHTTGYVGVTNHFQRRLISHKHRFKNLWNEIIVTKIAELPIEDCFDLEKKLRPTRNIGWNLSSGGYRNNAMYGKDNPNFGQIGEKASNFIGWYKTPLGKFASTEDAAKLHQCDASTISRRCKGRLVNGKFLLPKNGYAFEQKA